MKLDLTFLSQENWKIINEFLSEKRLALKSLNTLIQYEISFSLFFSTCAKQISEITYNDVSEWLVTYAKGKKPATIRCRLFNLICFFRFCQSAGYINTVPIKKRWFPKQDDSFPKFLLEADYIKVKRFSNNLPLRNSVIIELFSTSGIRCAELINLAVGDVDWEKQTAIVTGKGNKKRSIHFSKECSILMAQLILNTEEKEKVLFAVRHGHKLTCRHIRRIIHQVGKDAGIEKTLSPHVFRHTFATLLLNKGADMEFIAEELGHANINTTCIYGKLNLKRIKTVYDRCME